MNKELYDLSYSLKRELQHKVLFVILVILLVFLTLNLILNFILFPAKQVSASMEGDIAKGSVIMFCPLIRHYERGNVVLMKPRRQNPPSIFHTLLNSCLLFITGRQFSLDSIDGLVGSEYQVRRVIGMPGDTIYMRDYVLYIKPKDSKYFLTEFELIKRAYNTHINTNNAMWDTSIGVIGSFEERKLGPSEYFVLGDSRNGAIDSRLWGTVTPHEIKAKALFTYFPFTHLKLF